MALSPAATVRCLIVAALVAAAFGCTPAATQSGSSGLAPPPGDDRAPLEWARSEPYLVLVRRSCRTVSLYQYGQWIRTYGKVSFGRVPGVKVEEGDRRTPNGL